MKTYALVFTCYYKVMLYTDWYENQQGCVMETSDDREYLEGEAETRNLSQDDIYEDEREYDEQFN